MELGNLLGKLKGKEVEPEKFLALELTDDIVQAAVWQVNDSATEVVATGQPIPWNGDIGDLSALITAVDQTITKASEGLAAVPTQVIFGIPTTWIEGESVRSNKKTYIKQICTELELKPLGFVVVMDSVIRYLKMREGTPVTAILIQVADTELTVATVNLGRTHALATLPRTDDVSKDVEAAIARSARGLTQLPSRFVIFDGMHDLEEVVQNLTLVEWVNKFPFLHIPKIESLGKDIVIHALCVAGGSEVAKSIGFTIKDPEREPIPAAVTEETSSVVMPSANDLEALGFTTADDTSTEVEESIEEPETPLPPKQNFPKLLSLKASKLISSFHLPHFSFKGLPIVPIIILAILALIFFLFAGSLWLFPHASVTIAVTPRAENAEFNLTLDPAASTVDTNSFIVPSQPVQATVSGEETIPVTGSKQIGDPAEGEVTLYNRTGVKKTFVKGTLLTNGSLKFTLDEDITVASKSAGADYVDVPGHATGKITASTIGESGNLSAGTEFVIGTYSKDSYVGKNETALKGGNSKTVSAISAKDKSTLTTSLKSKLEQQAQDELQKSGDLVYIATGDSEITAEQYSGKVGDQADSLSGNLTLVARGYSLAHNDVARLSKQVLQEKLQGYALMGEPTFSLGGGGDKSVNVQAQAQALPVLDLNNLRNSLNGLKDGNAIGQIVGTIPGFDSVKVSITPTWLPPRLKSLPRKPENIDIKLVPAQ